MTVVRLSDHRPGNTTAAGDVEKPVLQLAPVGPPQAAQIRVPLTSIDDIELAALALEAGAARLLKIARSAKRQRNPDLMEPMHAARQVLKQVNRAVNARAKTQTPRKT